MIRSSWYESAQNAKTFNIHPNPIFIGINIGSYFATRLKKPNLSKTSKHDERRYSDLTCTTVRKDVENSSLPTSCTFCSSSSLTDFEGDIHEHDVDDASYDFCTQSSQDDYTFGKNCATKSDEMSIFWTEEMDDILTLKRANPVCDSDAWSPISKTIYPKISQSRGIC